MMKANSGWILEKELVFQFSRQRFCMLWPSEMKLRVTWIRLYVSEGVGSISFVIWSLMRVSENIGSLRSNR